MKKPIHWGLVAAFVVVAAILPGTLPSQLVSAAEAQSVQVLIDEVGPTPAEKNSMLRIRGRIANTGGSSISAPIVQLRLSPQPLINRGEVITVLDGSTDRTGIPVPRISYQLGSSLEPGEQSEFRIKTPISDLKFSDGAAVYALFAEALSGSTSLGRAGLLVPWFPKGSEYQASKLALAWPLTQKPALAAGQLVIDPALPREFAANGRLSKMLDVGSTAHVAWLVDSATVATAAELADGYRLNTPSGPQPGDQSDAAEQFGEQLTKTLANKKVALPGYAVADVDALNRSDLTSFVVRSATLPRVIGEADLKDSDLEDVFAAPDGFASAETLQVLVDAGIRNAILSDAAMPPNPELNYTPTGATTVEAAEKSLNILLSDARLNAILSRDLTKTESLNYVKQAFVAEMAMITLERPSDPRRILAQPPGLWDPPEDWAKKLLSEITSVPWIDMIQLDEVNSGELVDRSPLTYGRKQRRAELPQSYVQEIVLMKEKLEAFSNIVDSAGFGENFTLALERAGSSLWREDIPGRNRMVSTISEQLNDEQHKVRVVSTGSVTLVGDKGILPLTVANDLEESVTVGIKLQTDNQVRLRYEQPEPVTVEASKKVGLEVPITVVGSQPLEVTVAITDSKGQVFDDSAKLQVQSTASSRVAAVVAGIGALVFLILVGLRLNRRRSGA